MLFNLAIFDRMSAVPHISEIESNNTKDTSNLLSSADCIVDGKVDNYNDIDSYKIKIDSSCKLLISLDLEESAKSDIDKSVIALIDKNGNFLYTSVLIDTKSGKYQCILQNVESGEYYVAVFFDKNSNILINKKYSLLITTFTKTN